MDNLHSMQIRTIEVRHVWSGRNVRAIFQPDTKKTANDTKVVARKVLR